MLRGRLLHCVVCVFLAANQPRRPSQNQFSTRTRETIKDQMMSCTCVKALLGCSFHCLK